MSPNVMTAGRSSRADRRLGAPDVSAKRVAGGAPITPLCVWLGLRLRAGPSRWRGRRDLAHLEDAAGRRGRLDGGCSQRTRSYGDARQPAPRARRRLLLVGLCRRRLLWPLRFGASVWRGGKGLGDGGGAVGDAEPGEDVLQVFPHGGDRDDELAGDLGVAVPGGEQVQQFPLPG